MGTPRTKQKQDYNDRTYDTVKFRLKKNGEDDYTMDDIREAAAAEGKSLNALIAEAVKEKMRQIEEKNSSGSRPVRAKEEIDR